MAISKPTWTRSKIAVSFKALGLLLFASAALTSVGCFAPLRYHGIPARELPDTFRMPCRTAGPILNYASLTRSPQSEYVLGPDDVVEVTVHGLYPMGETRALRTPVMANGEIQLPLIGGVHVGGMNLVKAQAAITDAYANGVIKDPRVNVALIEKSTTTIMVLGEVNLPGVYRLPKYENDVAHALAMAGGLKADEAGNEIQIHRRGSSMDAGRGAMLDQLRAYEGGAAIRLPEPPMIGPGGVLLPEPVSLAPSGPSAPARMGVEELHYADAGRIIRIPLRGFSPEPLETGDVVVHPGDVIVVPHRIAETFYVVGKLSTSQFIRFSLGIKERELGNALILPRDREIDVVTAVAMAGYIDPIDSPTTVTVHRIGPNGQPFLVIVDLIKARYDRRETILVEPGDVIYLNPDGAWWGRRTFDTIFTGLFGVRFSHTF